MSKLCVLDVGHGNSTVYVDDQVLIVDGAPGATLIRFLRSEDIQTISCILVSHSDYDHLAGVIALLALDEFVIERIIVGPDASKRSRAWYNFAVAVADGSRNGTLCVDTSLNTSQPGTVGFGNCSLEVLYPSVLESLLPAGSIIEGHSVISNDTSAVIRVLFEGAAIALLTGDITSWGVTRLLRSGVDLKCPILVFPHHGAEMLPHAVLDSFLDAVSPELVVFSFARGRFSNPSPLVAHSCAQRGIRIACTQLSRHCTSDETTKGRSVGIPSAGASTGACCAGTLEFQLPNTFYHDMPAHQGFVDLISLTALCRARTAGNKSSSRQ